MALFQYGCGLRIVAVSNSSITKYSECFIQLNIITIDKNLKE